MRYTEYGILAISLSEYDNWLFLVKAHYVHDTMDNLGTVTIRSFHDVSLSAEFTGTI
jgi:hypothetical protein